MDQVQLEILRASPDALQQQMDAKSWEAQRHHE